MGAILAATFGWLCVETLEKHLIKIGPRRQPPSGGCVLKRRVMKSVGYGEVQPPSGGCVLKHHLVKTDSRIARSSHLRVAVC